jgi:hypothetical protein
MQEGSHGNISLGFCKVRSHPHTEPAADHAAARTHCSDAQPAASSPALPLSKPSSVLLPCGSTALQQHSWLACTPAMDAATPRVPGGGRCALEGMGERQRDPGASAHATLPASLRPAAGTPPRPSSGPCRTPGTEDRWTRGRAIGTQSNRGDRGTEKGDRDPDGQRDRADGDQRKEGGAGDSLREKDRETETDKGPKREAWSGRDMERQG